MSQQDFEKTTLSAHDGDCTGFADLIGTVVDGRYKIVERIGNGGAGEVFRAVHLTLESDAAIKVMHPHLIHNAEAVSRFVNEAKSASSLNHTNIVQILSTGKLPDGRPYMAMEFMPAESVRVLLDRSKVLPPQSAVGLLLQACAGLSHAHGRGILHRDLKPSNLLLTGGESDPVLKISDFGIAKVLDQEISQKLTATGHIFGSPAYMSPEQCRGLAVDARSDVYSLGCVAFEMLTGRPPFISESVYEVMYQHMGEEVPLFADIPGAVKHDPLETAVAKALSKEPSERFQSMDEFSQALQNALKGKEVRLQSAGTKRRRTRRQKLMMKAGLALLVVALAVAAWLQHIKPRIERTNLHTAGADASADMVGKISNAQRLKQLKARAQDEFRHIEELSKKHLLSRTDLVQLEKTMDEAALVAPKEALLSPEQSANAAYLFSISYRNLNSPDPSLERNYLLLAEWSGDVRTLLKTLKLIAEREMSMGNLDVARTNLLRLQSEARQRNYPLYKALAEAGFAKLTFLEGKTQESKEHVHEFTKLAEQVRAVPQGQEGFLTSKERPVLYADTRFMALVAKYVSPEKAGTMYESLLARPWEGPDQSLQTYASAAQYYAEVGQERKAAELVDKVLSASPSGYRLLWLPVIDAQRIRAELALRKGDKKAAIESLDAGLSTIKLLELDWGDESKRRTLARKSWQYKQLYANAGALDKALEVEKLALACDRSQHFKEARTPVLDEEWSFAR